MNSGSKWYFFIEEKWMRPKLLFIGFQCHELYDNNMQHKQPAKCNVLDPFGVLLKNNI